MRIGPTIVGCHRIGLPLFRKVFAGERRGMLMAGCPVYSRIFGQPNIAGNNYNPRFISA